MIGLDAIASGLIAWWRRPANRMGLLMTAFGFACAAPPRQYSHDDLVFTVFFRSASSASRSSRTSRSRIRPAV